MSTIFIVSLLIKLSLKMYHEGLTFVNHADDIKYHLTSFSMEIIEITEQYCYSMNIGISINGKLYFNTLDININILYTNNSVA